MNALQPVFDRLDAWVQQRMAAFRTPGLALALTDRNEAVHRAAFGVVDLATRVPVVPGTLFAIGSVGKVFTGVAVLRAVEAGLLDLHAPVTMYLPWFEVQSACAPITVHHLLTHTAGIIRGTDAAPDPRSEVWALRETETVFPPGTAYWYSDAGYKILGLVLEAVWQRSYAEIIQEQILDPLGMTATAPAITHALRPRMAQGYRPLYDDRPVQPRHPLVPAAWVETNSGDGCIASTAEDMAIFARMLLNGGQGVLSQESYRLLTAPHVDEGDGWYYGYGLNIGQIAGFDHIGHGGDMPGYEAYLWLDVENGVGVVVLSTQPYPTRTPFVALGQLRVATLHQPLPDLPPLPDSTQNTAARSYAGSYRADDGEVIFEAGGDQLFLLQDGGRVLIEWLDETTALIDHPRWDRYPVCFEIEANDQVVGFVHGPQWYATDGYTGPRTFEYPAEWNSYVGHYRTHNPWASNFRVVVRKGALLLVAPNGDEEPLTPLGDATFTIGDPALSPERIRFDQVVDGTAWRAMRSGCAYYRFFTP